MRRVASLYSSTVGKKVAMAATGSLLVLYVIGHMLGNLKVYQGAEKFNAYAEFLREVGAPALAHGEFLWIARIVLLAAVVIHIVAAVQLTRRSLAARPVRYRKKPHEELTYASRTMRWGGVIILLFVVYHILHLTTGTAHPDYVAGDAYRNLVVGFQSWPVAAVYSAAVVALGFHLYHGIWSGFQTVGWDNPRFAPHRRSIAGVIALVVVLGNLSFPIAVLSGFVA
jgi:succinate dehydrogenase / fumarate reductase cytochrome b subunit